MPLPEGQPEPARRNASGPPHLALENVRSAEGGDGEHEEDAAHRLQQARLSASGRQAFPDFDKQE